ncbi:tyrosine-type recombinase/integrase [Streptomyces sp. NPDC087525]|uniref:tyrosine-type recombinase/integrase n=1 Tax=Streptomyces sp. NPDC087525 TaxID=3365793 RepID=UPI003812A2AA
MASIVERPKKDGTTTFQVKWRLDGQWQTENFGDTDGATQFKNLVEAHGGKWPHGWVRGRGFVEPDEQPGDMPLITWANRYVSRLTGIDVRTREDYESEIRLHFQHIEHTTASGLTLPATICNLTQDDVTDWVRREQEGEQDPTDHKKWRRRPADPKSIRNRHGLLFCMVQAAVDATPQLRTTNCCKKTSLPRLDDHIDEEMTFLERDEYARVATEIKDPDARDLADWLVGTGMRWGEATAIQVRDLRLTADVPTVSVQRAWKKAKKGSPKAFYLGPPKTKKARRLVALTPAQVDMARRLTEGHPPEGFLFRAALGGAWRHANFYNRKWQPAVQAAVEKGLPKRPRIHDLRHTHVAWLIGANIPLPAIQARLGHESISTTVDRYGHLVRALDSEITAAVQAALGAQAPRHGRLRAVVNG